MKKALAVLLSLVLLAGLAVPAYAAEPYDADWIPPVPDFIIPAGNGFRFSYDVPGVPASKEYQDVTDWISTLAEDNALFLILLDQGVYNRYKEENNIDYDRQFSLYIVSPDKKSDGSYYDLGGFEHMGGPQHQQQMNVPGPMSYLCLNSLHSFAKVIYDLKMFCKLFSTVQGDGTNQPGWHVLQHFTEYISNLFWPLALTDTSQQVS